MGSRPIKKSDADKPWAVRKDRKTAKRDERSYILVASEDGKSSVYYFNALNKRLHDHSATVVVVPKGCGRNTQSLVDYVKKHKNDWLAEVRKDFLIDDFNETWILFDRDDFPGHKFDNAIRSAQSSGFQVAWSNECFELWYLLHFKDVSSAKGRSGIYDELTEFSKKALPLIFKRDWHYSELKGEAGRGVHEYMASNLNVGKAIKRARKLYSDFEASQMAPHEVNPCTLVFRLIEKLQKQLAPLSRLSLGEDKRKSKPDGSRVR